MQVASRSHSPTRDAQSRNTGLFETCGRVSSLGLGRIYSIPRTCFEFQPQIAIVANEAPLHLKTADILAEMGCHILIEKPIDIDLERCLPVF